MEPAKGIRSSARLSLKQAVATYKNCNEIRNYILLKKLGEGTFGCVRLGINKVTNKSVAVKTINKKRIKPIEVERSYRELNVMQKLSHPSIIQLYEVIDADDNLNIVMEFIEGCDLFEKILKDGRFSDDKARIISRQLVSALQYCHSIGIAHRDLKLENILCDGKENIKLIDFGFANIMSPCHRSSTFCGSPPYAAPELFEGTKYNPFKSDIWSLGVIIYVLVGGRLPFDAQTIPQMRKKVVEGKYAVPLFVTIPCELLLRKCLVVDPAKRADIKGVMTSKWINLNHSKDLLSPYEEKVEPVDDRKVTKLITMGFKKDDIMASINERKFDEIYAHYLMMKEADLPAVDLKRNVKRARLTDTENKVNRPVQRDLIQQRTCKVISPTIIPTNAAAEPFSGNRRNKIPYSQNQIKILDKSPKLWKLPGSTKENSPEKSQNIVVTSPLTEKKSTTFSRLIPTRATMHSTRPRRVSVIPEQKETRMPFITRLVSAFKIVSSKKSVNDNKK